MPPGKHPYLRFRIINKCLSSKAQKYWTLEEMCAQIQEYDLLTSPRTLERDLSAMRNDSQLGYYAPIEYCRKNRGYYYTQPGYSIEKLPITPDQLQLLEIASGILQRFKGMSFFAPMEEVVDKLGGAMKELRKPGTKEAFPFILFEEAAWQEGLQHLEPIINAIKDNQPLSITYNPFGKKTTVHHFHPYYLKQYKHRWYLIGAIDKKKLIFPLALDRIKKIENFTAAYKSNPIEDPEEFFKNIIGISYATASAVEVVLSFTPTIGNYIKTQFLHKSQQILIDDDKELRVSLCIVPNPELISTLMSFAPDVTVLEPDSLREKIKEVYKKGLMAYS